MKAYPKYKDSGIDWLGNVPEHWDVIALGRATISIKNGTTIDQNNYSTENYRVTRIETISLGTINYDKTGFVEYSPSLDNYKLNNGDILFSHINSMEYVGNCAIYEMLEPLYSGMNLLRIVPANFVFPKYLLYWLKSSGMKFEIQRNSKPAINQVSIPIGYVKSLPTLLQPFSEQQAIASYLDGATSRIDALIEKKEQMIELLKEKRIALITHAVTKGLDPNVKMKDSGIEWLGEVPEHWEIKKIKYAAGYKVSNVDKLSKETEIPVRLFNYTDVYNNDRLTKDMDLMNVTATKQEILNYRVFESDILITKDSENWKDIAKPAIVISSEKNVLCGYHLGILKSQYSRLIARYLFRLLQAKSINTQFQLAATGITRYGLPKSAVDEAIIPIPLVHEQEHICNVLDEEEHRLESLIEKTASTITLLNEYRSSLIHHAVTGKIDLRGYNAKTQ